MSTVAPAPPPATPPGRTYRWLLLALAVSGFVIDQASKYGMFYALYDGTPQGNREVVPGWFRFTAEFDRLAEPGTGPIRALQLLSAPVMPRVNHGALFGIGGEHKFGANAAFALVSALAAVGILVWGLRGAPARDRVLSFALGLILGGTLGNLYDRVVFNGVRDFLYFYKIEWPVFNSADCTLVAGAGVLLLHAFVTPSAKAGRAATEGVTDRGRR